MKMRFLGSCVLFCGLLVLGCGGGGKAGMTRAGGDEGAAGALRPVVEGALPKIVFEKTTHDFGEVGAGTVNSCSFPFRNDGEGLLVITQVTRSCGCTPVTLAKKEYKPGESGNLEVEYHAPAVATSQERSISVYSNDPERPKVDLTVKAKVLVRVVYEPARLNFSLSEGNQKEKVTITAKDGKEFSISSVQSAPSGVTADFDPAVKATKFVLEPKVDPARLKKGLTGILEIEITHPESKKIEIPFSILAKYNVTPPTIAVFNVEPGETTMREVWVLSNYGEDFEIESTSSEKGAVKVVSQTKQGARYSLKLDITPPALGNGKSSIFQDELSIKIKNDETLKVSVRGLYKRK